MTVVTPPAMGFMTDAVPAVEAIRDRLPGVTDVVTVGGPDDGYEAFLATARPAGRGRDVTAEDLWLVMYSSGTTGRPKGVMLTTSARAPSTSSTRCRATPAGRSSSARCAPRTGRGAAG